ncbi:MAG: NAD(P)/FAD-dependent oxidoreductase [Eubacteriales bacterium]|nr:NAD(P)/FAD-dependent oxidoreductase [Eubacteriales bacterium]
MRRVVVVGGGPAGLCASIAAARAGAETLLLERNEKLGKKLYLTGKGRCNLTNAADISDFFDHIPRNPRFLYSALYGFTNRDLIALVEAGGTPTKTERGGRVFPESDKASDVTASLERQMRASGVTVKLGCFVRKILVEDGRVTGVGTDAGDVPAEAVILACGGVTYPSTGSDGSWTREVARLGHGVVPMEGRLVGIDTRETWCGSLAGLTLRNVRFTAFERGKIVYTEQGEMLFTHTGISGPLVLSASSRLAEAADASFSVDLKPALDADTLDRRLVREFSASGAKKLVNLMPHFVPGSLGGVILETAGLDPARPAGTVTRAERARLASALKDLPLHGLRFRPKEEAIITRGGVDVGDVDPSTMRSKRVAGLYFAGEMLDVDACTGGFNITIAASTGTLAGRNAAQDIRRTEGYDNR